MKKKYTIKGKSIKDSFYKVILILKKKIKTLLRKFWSPNEPWLSSNSPVLLSDIYFWPTKIQICHSFLSVGKPQSLKTNCL